MLLCTKQLYILDAYGVDGHWNDNELKAPIVTRWRVEGQNWLVGYRMSTTGLTQSHYCVCTELILSLLQKLCNFSVGILNVNEENILIWCFFKTIGNLCAEFENMPHRANIGLKCQVRCCSLIWRPISPSNCSGYCDIVHWLIEKYTRRRRPHVTLLRFWEFPPKITYFSVSSYSD